jgi:hypothetical protein
MGRKEKSNLVRIEKSTRARRRKYTTTLQEISRQSIPGELITTVREYPAVVPTGSEYELLQDVLASSDNVFYKPRRHREYQVDSSNLQHWQITGFEHYADYIGYCQVWGLSQHTQELDILFQDDNKETHE